MIERSKTIEVLLPMPLVMAESNFFPSLKFFYLDYLIQLITVSNLAMFVI